MPITPWGSLFTATPLVERNNYILKRQGTLLLDYLFPSKGFFAQKSRTKIDDFQPTLVNLSRKISALNTCQSKLQTYVHFRPCIHVS